MVLHEVIRAERAVLLPLSAADADDLVGLLVEPQLREWLRVDDVGQLRARFAEWESRRSPDGSELWLNWVIRAGDNARPLGWVQATVRDDAASVAYALLPAERGVGIASAALRALVCWLRERLGTRTVSAEIEDTNLASARVAAAAGFVRTDRRVDGEAVWLPASC